MNTTWQGITQVIGVALSTSGQQFLAQSPNLQLTQPAVNQGIADVRGIVQQLILFTPRLLAAVAILLVGWLIALGAAALTRGILNRTNIDNRIAAGITGRQDVPQVEKLISSLVFWSIILLTAVAVLQTLDLEVASRPLNNFLNQLIGFLPKLVGAGILLVTAWFLATIVKIITVRSLQAFNLDERLNPEPEDSPPSLNQLS
ncbi:MAG: mechanosensitive ion channel family protein, partial [Nostoc sp.]